MGVNVRTIENWEKRGIVDGRTTRVISGPANKLSEEERTLILETVNSQEFRDLSPDQIVPILADRKQYIGSEATIYRILREEKMVQHRQPSKPRKGGRPDTFVASKPRQVMTWDITYMKREIKGCYFYLYMVMDIFSRKIVGWAVHTEETSEHAADLISRVYQRENLEGAKAVLHSDNGSPMKGVTMLATLQRLGIMPSFNRPSVSNDNPFSESLFRTLKYRPEYPGECFKSIEDAREWVEAFVTWYNFEHRHSGLKFVTPQQRHQGLDVEILGKRKQVYDQAKAANPSRWSGNTRNWEPKGVVSLNPCKDAKASVKEEQTKLLAREA